MNECKNTKSKRFAKTNERKSAGVSGERTEKKIIIHNNFVFLQNITTSYLIEEETYAQIDTTYYALLFVCGHVAAATG